jgi:hypothetical protein
MVIGGGDEPFPRHAYRHIVGADFELMVECLALPCPDEAFGQFTVLGGHYSTQDSALFAVDGRIKGDVQFIPW